jgi:hypothetical protein
VRFKEGESVIQLTKPETSTLSVDLSKLIEAATFKDWPALTLFEIAFEVNVITGDKGERILIVAKLVADLAVFASPTITFHSTVTPSEFSLAFKDNNGVEILDFNSKMELHE